jgi:LDH2 family malate/lactate/ureidoglycolate dehydrogenase
MPVSDAAASIEHQPLADLIAALFRAQGVGDADGALVADSLVQADLWGHQSHGVLRAPWYLERLRRGTMRADAVPHVALDAGALAVLDAAAGIGQVAAMAAAEEAIRRARAHGVGVVSVRDSNHFGTAMYYTLRAARAGMMGFMTTNGGPAMPPWGGKRQLVGTNPFSFAVPAGRFPPMVLDIANTAVARGKIYLAKNRGEPIPPGWAMTAEGEPTTDPVQAIEGLIMPMAGHKGYGLALMMDVLAGVLSGSHWLDGVNGPYRYDKRSGCGHLFVALDIARLRGTDEFAADMEAMITRVKESPRAPGTAEIFYPGEPEARADAEHRKSGLRLASDTLRDLEQEVRMAGLSLDALRPA